jgi:hypothetical protein
MTASRILTVMNYTLVALVNDNTPKPFRNTSLVHPVLHSVRRGQPEFAEMKQQQSPPLATINTVEVLTGRLHLQSTGSRHLITKSLNCYIHFTFCTYMHHALPIEDLGSKQWQQDHNRKQSSSSEPKQEHQI